MKVFELIEKLKQVPQDDFVIIAGDEGNVYSLTMFEEWELKGKFFDKELNDDIVYAIVLG